jgi:glucuronate isomerase
LELQRYFNVHDILNGDSAEKVYENCSALLQTPEYSVRNLLGKMNVKVVCTTDDPIDSLEYHQKIKDNPFGTEIYPAFRPDKAMNVDDSKAFNTYIGKLEEVTNCNISSYKEYLDALKSRHDFFALMGCSVSDHGLEQIYAEDYTDAEIEAAFTKIRSGKELSIGDFSQAKALAKFLNRLDSSNQLTKTILYNLNPADNELMATMIGNYNDGSIPGKVQFGSAWWFLDQKDGMIKQLNALSNMGLLSRFVGMLTDSRSFLSYPRHEYFRRIVCKLFGEEIENGELPADISWTGKIIQDICYNNASNYFNWKPVEDRKPANVSI